MASRLRFPVRNRPRKFSGTFGAGTGPEERMLRIRKVLTRLIRDERIEGNYSHLLETRGYTELVCIVLAMFMIKVRGVAQLLQSIF